MDGTNALVIDRVRLIDRAHFRAYPVPVGWPRLFENATNPHFPRFFMRDICTGSDHVTLTTVANWKVTSGTFDPFQLYGHKLKQYENLNTITTQTLDNLQTGIQYNITVNGTGIVSFSGTPGTLYSWGRNNQRFNNDTKTIEFLGSAPRNISIKVESGDIVSEISMTDSSGVEYIVNKDFTQHEKHFYDIEGWFVDSEDKDIIPDTLLGYLQGFNDSQIFTIFE